MQNALSLNLLVMHLTKYLLFVILLKLNYFFKHTAFLSAVSMYLFVDLFLDINNDKFLQYLLILVAMRFQKQKFSTRCVPLPYDWTNSSRPCSRYLLKLLLFLYSKVEWASWKHCETLHQNWKPEFLLLLISTPCFNAENKLSFRKTKVDSPFRLPVQGLYSFFQ